MVLVTEGHGPAERLVELVREADVGARLAERAEPVAGVAVVTCGQLGTGFVSETLRLAVLTETDLAGHAASPPGTCAGCRAGGASGIDPLQLEPGDLRRARAPRRRPLRRDGDPHGGRRHAGNTWCIEYAKGDRLYVPTDHLEQVSRYVGGEAPTLDRIGGADWAKRKGRARKAVKQIAGELDPALQRPDGLARPRLRPGHPVAARAGGRLPLSGRPPTSSPRSTRSRPTWRNPSRWTG